MATASVNIPNLFSKFKYFQKLENTMQQRRAEIEAMENSNAQAATRKNKENKITTLKNRLTPLQAVLYGLTSSLKQVDFSYNETSGISLPGILSSPNFYGYGQGVGGPTYGFLLGSQADIRRVMIERGWVTSSDLMTESYVQLQTKAITGSIQIQPMNDLKIDLNFLKNYSSSLTHNGYNIMTNNRLSFANEIIAFSHTDILMGTSFKDGGQLYMDMVENARVLSRSMPGVLGADGFVDGYGLGNSYILIPAFKAAVGGKNLSKENRFLCLDSYHQPLP